jgi:type IV pilus assembly protein PilQ
VPYLEDVPGVGYLFKTKGRSNQAEDLLIFITPYILQPAAVSGN